MSLLIDRFEGAVQTLIGDGPIKTRLARAYAEFLEDISDLDSPVSGNGAFSDLHAALHRVAPIGSETAVKASVQKMSTGEAAWHATTILRLYSELLSQPRRVELLKVVETATPAPPQFLAGGG
jgi:hypothetical protein